MNISRRRLLSLVPAGALLALPRSGSGRFKAHVEALCQLPEPSALYAALRTNAQGLTGVDPAPPLPLGTLVPADLTSFQFAIREGADQAEGGLYPEKYFGESLGRIAERMEQLHRLRGSIHLLESAQDTSRSVDQRKLALLQFTGELLPPEQRLGWVNYRQEKPLTVRAVKAAVQGVTREVNRFKRDPGSWDVSHLLRDAAVELQMTYWPPGPANPQRRDCR